MSTYSIYILPLKKNADIGESVKHWPILSIASHPGNPIPKQIPSHHPYRPTGIHLVHYFLSIFRVRKNIVLFIVSFILFPFLICPKNTVANFFASPETSGHVSVIAGGITPSITTNSLRVETFGRIGNEAVKQKSIIWFCGRRCWRINANLIKLFWIVSRKKFVSEDLLLPVFYGLI